MEVTYNEAYDGFSGSIIIPEEVSYMSKLFKVTSIGDWAFDGENISSVNIPNTITNIGEYAFCENRKLTSLYIPKSVIKIGFAAFSECSGLTSIIVEKENAYYDSREDCNAIIETETNTLLFGCMTSIIPNSIIIIKDWAFCDCGLTSITIPNSVTDIGYASFAENENLKSVIIPNSVKTIGDNAFNNCDLTSLTIGSNVTSIGEGAFSNGGGSINHITTIVSLMERPCKIQGPSSVNPSLFEEITFTKNTFYNATLYVPTGTINRYRETLGWEDFVHIMEIDGSGDGGDSPEEKQCAKPKIYYNNGELSFSCDTEDVEFKSSITNSDIKNYTTSSIQLTVTYHVSVYATKSGYQNSDVAEGTLCWVEIDPQKEGIVDLADGVSQVKALPVLIQAENGIISVQGAPEGTEVSIYSAEGKQEGAAITRAGVTTIHTGLKPGSVAIVRIGSKAVKVMMNQ